MSDKSAIEWTDATWNPIRGCSKLSPGCDNCYAMHVAARFMGTGQPYEGLAKRRPTNWTGDVRFVEERLRDPLRWSRPRRIFVDSMSDLFHEQVPDEWIYRVLAVMAFCRQHTFQVLTKRAARMRDLLLRECAPTAYYDELWALCDKFPSAPPESPDGGDPWPLPNVWLGVSVENQVMADQRIPLLLQTPAAVRFVSYEPALEAVDFHGAFYRSRLGPSDTYRRSLDIPIDWLIVGGESGPKARPCDVAWIRAARDQCRAASVPCFVKQLGSRPYDSAQCIGSFECVEQVGRALAARIASVTTGE